MTTDDAPLAGGRMSYLFLLVRDFSRMLGFYRDTLGFTAEFLQEDRFAFLRLGASGPRVALYPGRESAEGDGSHWLLAFDVPDLERTVAGLTERGVDVGQIHDVPYGRAATFEDPEGNALEVHEPEGTGREER